jgi:hypothetical protein
VVKAADSHRTRLPKAGNDWRLYELSTILRIHFMQQWFYSDATMGKTLHDALITAPPSTKSRDGQRDPEMNHTKKDNQ